MAGCIVASICIDCNMSCKVVNSYFYLLHLSLYLTFQDLFVGLSWVPGLAYISAGMNNSVMMGEGGVGGHPMLALLTI